MNLANKIDKSVVQYNMEDEKIIEIVANTRSESYADAVRYDHVRKILILQNL